MGGWGPPGLCVEERDGEISAVKLRVIVERDEDGVYVAEVPQLPGCVSQGETRAAALDNVREAARGYVASLRAHDDPVPPGFSEDVIELP